MSPEFRADYFEAAKTRRSCLSMRLSIMLIAGACMAIVIGDRRAGAWLACVLVVNLLEIWQFGRTSTNGARNVDVIRGMACEALSTTVFACGSFLAWSYGDAQGGAGAVTFLFGGCAMALFAANGSQAAFVSTIAPYLAVGLALCAHPAFEGQASVETPALLAGFVGLSGVICLLWRKSREAQKAERDIRARLDADRRRAEAAEQAYARLANEDALTGLPNRRCFDSELATRAAGGPFSLFLIDLNGFKKINDTLGHSCGDEILIETSRRLSRDLAKDEFVARLGGDEFAILAPAPASNADFARRAQEILVCLQDPMPTSAGRCHSGASVGAASSGRAGRPDEVLRHADCALYRSKEHKPLSTACCYLSPADSLYVTSESVEARRAPSPAPFVLRDRPRLMALPGGR